ncbi:MAG: hypothetical protein IT378_15755 [Sandaracinaceae bacterium]|nr:TRAP transporter TatT component family protein [Sandaracinaceae bacterium]MCC6875762.1 hypothetical protein [Sandaracinaceae bacterium]
MQIMPRLVTAITLVLAIGCGSSYQAAWDTPAPTQSAEAATAEGQSRRQELIAQGDQAWQGRDDAEQIRAAIRAWEQAVELDGTDHETWVKISRGYYFLADGHLRFSDEAAMGETYQSGIRAAERALVAISPEFGQRMQAGERVEQAVGVLEANAVPALYWRATNLGKWAQREGFATVLSFKDEIRAVMTRCLEADRYYFFAGPDRYFGAFFAIAPSYAGGDLDRSRQHFEESIRRFPDYFGTHVLFAENYAVKSQNRQLFTEQLQLVINGDPETLADAAPENRVEQRKARDLLARADELFE